MIRYYLNFILFNPIQILYRLLHYHLNIMVNVDEHGLTYDELGDI